MYTCTIYTCFQSPVSKNRNFFGRERFERFFPTGHTPPCWMTTSIPRLFMFSAVYHGSTYHPFLTEKISLNRGRTTFLLCIFGVIDHFNNFTWPKPPLLWYIYGVLWDYTGGLSQLICSFQLLSCFPPIKVLFCVCFVVVKVLVVNSNT